MINGNNKPYRAISFQTLVLNDLTTYMNAEGIAIDAVTPSDFIHNPKPTFQYINLVNKDTEMRKLVSETLTKHQLDRFSFIHPSVVALGADIGPGSMIYPMCAFMPTAVVGNDVLMFSGTCVAHNTTIKQGTVLASRVTISGSSTIGEYCFIGTGSTIVDKVNIHNDVVLSAGSMVKQDISEPGYYINNQKKNNVIPNYRLING